MQKSALTVPGPAPSIAPTLDDLYCDLARAEFDLECARMIDDWPRCQRETDLARKEIARIKAQIERIQECF